MSSIEFGKDNEFFAIAGVTKKIKLFDYATVVKDTLDIHYPIIELECQSKISCVSWSNYYKSMMASSDYEGELYALTYRDVTFVASPRDGHCVGRVHESKSKMLPGTRETLLVS